MRVVFLFLFVVVCLYDCFFSDVLTVFVFCTGSPQDKRPTLAVVPSPATPPYPAGKEGLLQCKEKNKTKKTEQTLIFPFTQHCFLQISIHIKKEISIFPL